MLIATRAVMGIGGAFIMPATLSILTNVFTEPKERAKAIGIWAGVSALGLGLGPITGGFLLTHFWWGSVFLVNIPIVIAGLVLGYLFVPDSKDPAAPRLDPVGALLSIVGLAVVLAAVIEAPDRGWTSPEILAGFVVGFAVLAAFMVWEMRSTHPMLNLDFFKNPRFSAASGAITLTFFALFGMIFLLTQYLQLVLGYSTIKAGAVLLPQAAVIMVAAPLSSVWVERLGNKVVVATGMFAGVGLAGVVLPASAWTPRSAWSSPSPCCWAWAWATSWPRRPTPSWVRSPGPRPASARRSTTPPARPVGRSASPCSARSCPRATSR